MTPYVLTRRAQVDLQQIWNYLAENASFQVADQVLSDLYEGVKRLADSPGLAIRHPHITDPSLRSYRVHSYYIVIVHPSSPMTVIRVVHTARDLGDLF